MVEVPVRQTVCRLAPLAVTMPEEGIRNSRDYGHVFPPWLQVVMWPFASAGETCATAVCATEKVLRNLALFFLYIPASESIDGSEAKARYVPSSLQVLACILELLDWLRTRLVQVQGPWCSLPSASECQTSFFDLISAAARRTLTGSG
jgi:hypothetical protein